MSITLLNLSPLYLLEGGVWFKRGGQSNGKSKGGMSAKLHLAMTTSWHIIEGFLTAGNRNDIAVVEELTADIVGCDVIQDRGYDSNKNRPNLESQNNITVIPGRKNRKTEIVYDREKYKLRGDVVAFLDLFVNLRSSSLIDVDHIQVLNFPV